MNFKRFHESKNLFDYSTITTGYRIQWTTGADYADATAIRSDYISVDSGTYSCSDSVIVLGYDDSKNYLGATDGNGVFEKIAKNPISQFIIPTNSLCKYVKILAFDSSVPMNIDAETMLNTGSQPLPYDPYSSEVWHDIPHYVHNTSTDTLTTLPAVLYPNDTTATVGLKGQMEQSSTPSPSSPIMPQECGERTGNLFDKSQPSTVGFVREDGTINENNNYRISDYIQLLPNTQYTVSNMNVNGLYPAVCFYTDNKTYISGIKYDGATVFTFTTPSNCKYVLVSYLLSLVNNVMLNEGSTALPYEPYGQYKIPILNNSQTTNVYLGEVESTRRIKKLVLTGEENWALSATNSVFYITDEISNVIRTSPVCSHFKGVMQFSEYDEIMISQTTKINIKTTYVAHNLTDFTTYLAQQYANGTPVTVWYVLATPTTGILNEPIRKIGDYADTVSGITIPVTAGANTISIGTTLEPSEVTATYKGWHPVQSVHERENGQWD